MDELPRVHHPRPHGACFDTSRYSYLTDPDRAAEVGEARPLAWDLAFLHAVSSYLCSQIMALFTSSAPRDNNLMHINRDASNLTNASMPIHLAIYSAPWIENTASCQHIHMSRLIKRVLVNFGSQAVAVVLFPTEIRSGHSQ